MIRKEFIQMRRDRLTLGMMLALPCVQLLLFGYAINTDVKNISTAVLDYSRSEESRRLLQDFVNSGYFVIVDTVDRPSEINDLIDRGAVRVGIIIDPEYSQDLKAHRPAHVQVLVDASDPQVAASTLSNAQGIAQSRSLDTLLSQLPGGGRQPGQALGTAIGPDTPPVAVEVRAWYNPDLVTANYIVPGLIGIILTMTMMQITAMAIVRERETGTLEQLATTPLLTAELMVGKIVPYIVVGYVQVTVALVVGIAVFHVPIRGSLVLLYTLCLLHITAYLGLGLLISSAARTQQQAMQMSFFMFLPTMLLSGFMFPRDGMPMLAQKVGLILPLTYFLQILRGIVLKGVGVDYLMQFIGPMVGLDLLIFMLAVIRFNQQRQA